MYLDYAKAKSGRWRGRDYVVTGVWVVSAAIYAFLCLPAMGQRGYPPIDAWLQGLAWTWVAVIPLTALYEPLSRRRVYSLLFYAVVTASIEAASWPVVVPNFFDPFIWVMRTVFLYGPMHLLTATVLEATTRGAVRVGSRIVRRGPGWLWKCFATAVVLTGAVLIPEGYAHFDHWQMNQKGREMADQGWASHDVVLYKTGEQMYAFSDSLVTLYVEPATGMYIEPGTFGLGYEAAYNERIAELLRSEGRPAWAAPRIPDPSDIDARLKSGGFTEIRAFPYEVNPNITITTGSRGFAKWGIVSASTSAPPRFTIHSAAGGDFTTGGAPGSIYVGRDAGYPGVVFVRQNHSCLVVLDEDGRLLAEAEKPD